MAANYGTTPLSNADLHSAILHLLPGGNAPLPLASLLCTAAMRVTALTMLQIMHVGRSKVALDELVDKLYIRPPPAVEAQTFSGQACAFSAN